jgi:hypothetical protein
MDRVFETPELLESILLCCPLREILRIQVVSCNWRNIITGSPSIQQRLFFQPITSIDHEPDLNPLLQILFPLLFLRCRCHIGRGYLLADLPEAGDMISVKEMKEEPFFADANKRPAVLQEDASWRRMFPVQPPTRLGKVIRGGGCDAYEVLEHGKISPALQHLQTQGARMGLIYDVLVHELAENTEAGVNVDWLMFPDHFMSESGEGELVALSADVPEAASELARENTITLYCLYVCHCDARHRDDEDYDAAGLRIVRCEDSFIEWEMVADTA